LLFVCTKRLSSIFDSFRRAYDAGEVFHEALDALYQPGTLLVARDIFNQRQLLMCLATRYEFRPDQYERQTVEALVVVTWCMSWDPSFQHFKRRLLEFRILDFNGTRRIDQLPISPLEYYGDETEIAQLKTELAARGRRWAHMVSQKPSCWQHEGISMEISSRISRRDRYVYEDPRTTSVSLHTTSTGFPGLYGWTTDRQN
jgi:hypothetical protein